MRSRPFVEPNASANSGRASLARAGIRGVRRARDAASTLPRPEKKGRARPDAHRIRSHAQPPRFAREARPSRDEWAGERRFWGDAGIEGDSAGASRDSCSRPPPRF